MSWLFYYIRQGSEWTEYGKVMEDDTRQGNARHYRAGPGMLRQGSGGPARVRQCRTMQAEARQGQAW